MQKSIRISPKTVCVFEDEGCISSEGCHRYCQNSYEQKKNKYEQ